MSRGLTVTGFVLCLVAAVVLEMLARARRDRRQPLGELFTAVMQRRSTRVAIVVFWWWIGWHFFVEP